MLIDEKIAQARNEAKKQKYSDIETGMLIDDELLTFSRRNLFEDRVSIMLPEQFVNMPKPMAKHKFPSEDRPRVIICNLLGTVCFGFNYANDKIDPDSIVKANEAFRQLLNRMHPGLKIKHFQVEDVRDTKLGWFDFTSPALDGMLYNISFVTSVNGVFMQGIFHCLSKQEYEWRPAALQVLRSMERASIAAQA